MKHKRAILAASVRFFEAIAALTLAVQMFRLALLFYQWCWSISDEAGEQSVGITVASVAGFTYAYAKKKLRDIEFQEMIDEADRHLDTLSRGRK